MPRMLGRQWSRDERGVSSTLLTVAISGVLFIGSLGVVLIAADGQGDSLDTDRADGAVEHQKATQLSQLFTRSPGYADHGTNVVDWAVDPDDASSNHNPDKVTRLGLTDPSSFILDYDKIRNLQDAPFAADSDDGFLNYEEARKALGLTADGLDFHIRGYPSMKSLDERLADGLRDQHLRIMYIGDYERDAGAPEDPEPHDGLTYTPIACGISPASDQAIRLNTTLTNGGINTTQFLTVFELDFGPGPAERRQSDSYIVDPGGDVEVWVDFPRLSGQDCADIDELELEIHDPELKLIEDTSGPSWAATSGTTATVPLEVTTDEAYWITGEDDIVVEYDGATWTGADDMRITVRQGTDPSDPVHYQVDFEFEKKKQDREHTIPAGTLAAGDYALYVEHLPSGVMLSRPMSVIEVGGAPMLYAPAGGSPESVTGAGTAVATEVGFLDQLSKPFCPYLYYSTLDSPLATVEPWADRCVVEQVDEFSGFLGTPNIVPGADVQVSCVVTSCDFSGAGSSHDAPIVNYTWHFGDGNTGWGKQVEHAYGSIGSYDVTLVITDARGAKSKDTESIFTGLGSSLSGDSNDPPPASIGAVCDGFACDFDTPEFDDDGIANWEWDFGDGTVISGGAQNDRTPSHTFPGNGTYPIKLNVTDDAGAWSLDVEELQIVYGVKSFSKETRPGDIFPDLRDDLMRDLKDRIIYPEGHPHEGQPRLDKVQVLIVGSMVDHQPMVHIRDEVAAWVEAGGYLIVLGSEDTNTQWMESIYKLGIHSSSNGVHFDDAQHPILHVTEALDYEGFESEGDVWKFTGQGKDSFVTIASTEDDATVMAVSKDGAFGRGKVAITSWFPFDMKRTGAPDSEFEGLKFVNNLLMLGYRGLYLDYGPSIPEGVEVVPAVSRAPIEHPDLGLVTMTLIVYVFPGG